MEGSRECFVSGDGGNLFLISAKAVTSGANGRELKLPDKSEVLKIVVKKKSREDEDEYSLMLSCSMIIKLFFNWLPTPPTVVLRMVPFLSNMLGTN